MNEKIFPSFFQRYRPFLIVTGIALIHFLITPLFDSQYAGDSFKNIAHFSLLAPSVVLPFLPSPLFSSIVYGLIGGVLVLTTKKYLRVICIILLCLFIFAGFFLSLMY